MKADPLASSSWLSGARMRSILVGAAFRNLGSGGRLSPWVPAKSVVALEATRSRVSGLYFALLGLCVILELAVGSDVATGIADQCRR